MDQVGVAKLIHGPRFDFELVTDPSRAARKICRKLINFLLTNTLLLVC
jgi:hypothetical protein